MAGFQVANFTFGKNTIDKELKQQQMALQAANAQRSADIQVRGQDIGRENAEANRAENARQFDAQMADKAAQRDESAYQFDKSAQQKDRAMGLEEARFMAGREDKERENSWNDALKQQEWERNELEFQKRNEELNRIMAIRKQEDDERAHQQELMESSYGNAIIASELSGGFLSPGQVKDFNENNGTKYNYIGRIDPTTGRNFSDNKIHFVTYNTDENGQVVMDQQSGRPTLLEDNAISTEFFRRTLDGYFGKYKGHFEGGSGSSGLTFEQRQGLENQKFEGRKMLKQMDVDARKYATDANNAERRYATDANNNTRLKIADLGAELKRMGYDVDEKKLAEAIRHNKATEAQGQQRVDETTRHNKAGEAHRTAELGERTRHNAVTEEQGQQRLDETATHHAATEEQGNRRLDETERAHKAGEAHRTAELDERKRANAEKENAVKETLELKRRAQDLRERLAKPQNNVFTADADPKVIKAKMQEVETIQKVIRNGNLTPENRTLLRSQLNAITESLYGGDSTTTNKVTIKSGDNKGNGSQQKVKPPEGAQMPQGAIAFGGYKQNKKTGKLVPYWVGPDNKPIYR